MEGQQKVNERGFPYTEFECHHLPLNELSRSPSLRANGYIHNTVPEYPKPEFHIRKVSHVTPWESLEKIMVTEGIKSSPGRAFSYWSLQIDKNDKTAAEMRYFNAEFPDDAEENPSPPPFLSRFTTSPAFQKESRYGNYRFTFPIQHLLNLYREQFCDMKQPEIKIYNTEVYKREIVYTVLVHNPGNELFQRFPPLPTPQDTTAVCAYQADEGNIVWRAQAICHDHQFQMVIDKARKTISSTPCGSHYYVWDHVVLAFHIPEDEIFQLGKRELYNSLTACGIAKVKLCKNYETSEDVAELKIKKLKPESDDDGEDDNEITKGLSNLNLKSE